MKVLFGVNITYDEENEKEDGSEFIIRRVPESLLDAYEPQEEEEVNKEDKLTEWKVKIFNAFAVCVLGVGTLGLITPIDEEELSLDLILGAIKADPLWFLVSGLITALGIVLLMIILPDVICFVTSEIFRKIGWIKEGDQSL